MRIYYLSNLILSEDAFDWYQDYSALSPFIKSQINYEANILMIGAGNSSNLYLAIMFKFEFCKAMSEEMVKEGFKNITNIDISEKCVMSMREKYKDMPSMKCENVFRDSTINSFRHSNGRYESRVF
jgi:2-polyprenyl-3-methyl-5-hydroxy-6-metoxy-1,4-benzoquinol methylase